MPFAPATMATPDIDHFDPGEAAEAPAASDPAPMSSGLFFHQTGSPAAPASSEFEVRSEAPAPESEIDISAEWEGEVTEEPTPAAFAESAEASDADADHARSETITETIEELRFYLAHSMVEQARLVFAKLEKLKPGADKLAAVQQEIEVAESPNQFETARSSRRVFRGRGR